MCQKKQTVKKVAKAACCIAKTMRILLYVATGIMVAALVFVLVYSEQTMGKWGMSSNSTGAAMLRLGPFIADIEMGRKDMICLLSSSIVSMIITTATLYYLGAIFKAIQNNGSPFDIGNITRLKRAAIGIALLSIVPSLTGVAVGAMLGTAGLAGLHIEVTHIAMAFFFLCLAYIFEYGAELQEQFDETL